MLVYNATAAAWDFLSGRHFWETKLIVIEIEFDIVPGREGKNLFWIKRPLATSPVPRSNRRSRRAKSNRAAHAQASVPDKPAAHDTGIYFYIADMAFSLN